MSAMQDKLSALRNKYKAKPKPKSTKTTKMLSRKNTKKSLKPAPKPAAKPSAAKLSYKQHMANLNKGILMDSDSEDSDDKRRRLLRMKKRRQGQVGGNMVEYKTGKKVKSTLVKRME